MDHAKARRQFDALAREVGPKADVYVSLNTGYPTLKALRGTIYPDGISGRTTVPNIKADADDYPALLVALRAGWLAQKADQDRENVRKMAGDIMRAYLDHNACTTTMLRVAGWSSLQIEEYGPEATAQANTAAERGPYSITSPHGSNGAPDEIEAGSRVAA